MKNNTKLSSKEAAEILGCTSRHIQNLIKKGKISASRDDFGAYVIDKSEFYRVFPDTHKERTIENDGEIYSRTVLDNANNEIEILKRLLKEKEIMNQMLMEMLDTHVREKSIILDTLNNNQMLLEDMRDIKERMVKKRKLLGIF